MEFMEAIAILIAGILARAMVHGLMLIALFRQAVVNIVFASVNHTAWRNGLGDYRLDRLLQHIGQHMDQ